MHTRTHTHTIQKQTHRHTDTQTDRQTDRQTRQNEAGREMDPTNGSVRLLMGQECLFADSLVH